jgi:hypothetical protein
VHNSIVVKFRDFKNKADGRLSVLKEVTKITKKRECAPII